MKNVVEKVTSIMWGAAAGALLGLAVYAIVNLITR